MPLYLFQCPKCGEVFELLRPLRESHDPIKHCGEEPMKRLPTTASFTVGGFNAKNGYSK